MPTSPLITVIIPTRDRPRFVRWALQALARQSFRNFEVIVSDNSISDPFVPEPQEIDGDHVRYVRPPTPVWMTDHWEFAITHARGRYISMLGDKSLLVPEALSSVAAEIDARAPDAVSWRYANFTNSTDDPVGRGVLRVMGGPGVDPVRISAKEALDYLVTTYLGPDSQPDHQLETRGSIYHGVFAASLVTAMKVRFGRVFRFYAPDINAQCAGLQIAHKVTHIRRPLELRLAGPSNGYAMLNVSHILKTQADAARTMAAPRLIPGLSASNAHLLACDVAAATGRTLEPAQWAELYRRAAFDLYRAEGWPDVQFRKAQLKALETAALLFDPGLAAVLAREKLRARTAKVRAVVMKNVRACLGSHADQFRDRLGDKSRIHADRTFVASVPAALAALPSI